MSPQRKDLLTGIPRYLAGLEEDFEQPLIADLSLNESRLGPSAAAIAAYAAEQRQLWCYPDGSHRQLKAALSAKFGVEASCIACGAGSNEIITLLPRLLASPGEEILFPQFSFLMFKLSALRAGAIPTEAPASGFSVSVSSIISAITSKTRAIFLANPNNPTGTFLSAGRLKELASKVPAEISLIVDSAYCDYMNDPGYSDGRELLRTFPNVVVLRTFSKIYGLASLRIGWCFASPPVVDAFERLRGPYSIAGPALAAATAALADDEHLMRVRHHNAISRAKLMDACARAGIPVEPAEGNFILCRLTSGTVAGALYRFLRGRGIRTRQLPDYDLAHCLRITVGTVEENELLIKAIGEFGASG